MPKIAWLLYAEIPVAPICREMTRGSPLDRLRTWALDLQERRGHNKAAVALANKLARIVWATWRHERDFSSKP
jgi:transposase